MTKKIFTLLMAAAVLTACKEQNKKGHFQVAGTIKKAPDQKVYLDRLFFSQQPPETVDTADLKDGAFQLSANAPEQGLYRIRMEKSPNGYLLINDQPKFSLTANTDDSTISGYSISSPANVLMQGFMKNIEQRVLALNKLSGELQGKAVGDSSSATLAQQHSKLAEEYKTYIIRFIDTVSNPVAAMFALGNTQGIDPAQLSNEVGRLPKRFPGHKGVEGIVTEYNNFVAKSKEPAPSQAARPAVGSIAPDFTMNDTNGKPFSLKDLRGKYVLVDFWASWCGPCRGENPNVVAAYDKFKARNFTILGVSLDEDKEKWLAAIKKDNLSWKQVSDLKQWNSLVVPLYGFDGIPYNVLIDPSGKIVAAELRGEALHSTLEKVLP